MNEGTRNRDTVEAAVSATYKELATEQPGEALDAAILAKAGRALRAGDNAAWRSRWYRPVALVATIGLSVALLLEMADMALLGTPGNRSTTLDDATTKTATGDTGNVPDRAVGDVTGTRADSPGAASPVIPLPPGTPATDALPGIGARSQLPGDPDARCSDEQRRQPSTWWRCIEDLEKRNLGLAAERELQELLQQYPGFSIPD